MTQGFEIDKIKEVLRQSIGLRQDLIQAVIDRDFKGNASSFARSLELDAQPHRKTISRWVQNLDNLPKSPQRLLALAQALDIDPFLLIDLKPEQLEQVCNLASWNMTWGSIHKALAFMNNLFTLTPEHWPPQEIAAYFDGDWYCQDFIHNPSLKRNYFKAFQIHPEMYFAGDGSPEVLRSPQAWYLAFRDVSMAKGQVIPKTYWRPFGMLKYEQNRVFLLHFTGLQQSIEMAPEQNSFLCETFFGQGAAEFRISSLHPFEFSEPENTQEKSMLRFGFPE